MRRALGHLESNAGGSARPPTEVSRTRGDNRTLERHTGDRPRARFVQDGDVPVTILNRSRPHEGDSAGSQTPSRLSLAEAALASERTARARAERALTEANAAVHDLETKWRHAELARQEQSSRAQAAMAAMEAELATLRSRETALLEQLEAERLASSSAERVSRHVVVEEAHEAAPPRRAPRQTVMKLGEERSASPSVKQPKRAPRTAGPKPREPKPVKWWLSSAKKP